MSKHAIRRLRRDIRRLEARNQRDMRRLRDEIVHLAMQMVPEPDDKAAAWFVTVPDWKTTVTS